MKSNFRIWLLAAVCVVVAAATSCGKDDTDGGKTPPTPPAGAKEINTKMDNYLKDSYLWNVEYKTLKPDFTLEYDEFLSKTLLSMTTNIYDKKKDSNNNFYLYSYVSRTPKSASSVVQTTRGVNHGVEKEAETSFGIAALGIFSFTGTSFFGFAVEGVYPGSPAEVAGIKRGFMIQQVDGKNIDESNYVDLYNRIIAPGGVKTVVLTENAQGRPTKTLTSKSIFPNPVLYSTVKTSGSHKIGYIVYSGFDAAYDDELLAAIKACKDGGARDARRKHLR